MTIHVIDVGQGDSIFIDNGDYEVLIDAGTASMGSKVSSYINPYVDGNLELILGTHAHADHIGGLTSVINDYDVSRVIDSGERASSKAWEDFFFVQPPMKKTVCIAEIPQKLSI